MSTSITESAIFSPLTINTNIQDIAELKVAILDAIKEDNYDFNTLMNLFSPINEYVTNQTFTSSLTEIVNILKQDRDNNSKFTIDDLKLIKNDLSSIISLVNYLLLLVGSLSTTKLKYNAKTTEMLIFKLLSYVFLVVVPKTSQTILTLEDKSTMLELILSIYKIMLSTKMAQDLISKVNAWFGNGGCFSSCSCNNSKPEIQDVLDEKKLEITRGLTKSIELKRSLIK
jgi:hypothetical protein